MRKSILLTATALGLAFFAAQVTAERGIPVNLLINEVDADQISTDSQEFVELYDGGVGNTPLDGYVVVLFNGSDNLSYNDAVDLDGFSTDTNGFFVIGSDQVPNVDLIIGGAGGTNLIQNGADAVALILGDAVDYPNDTPIPAANIIDAIVYDTNDSDDADLLVLLNAGEPQVNEGGGGNSTAHSNSRCGDGSGGARNTSTYVQVDPTPGGPNACAAPIYSIVCAGDGNSGACPCANESTEADEGCINGSGAGAIISASGTDVIVNDDLVFHLSQAPANEPCLLFQGSSLFNFPFADGVYCTASPTERIMPVLTTDLAGEATTAVSIATVGNVSVGETKIYQWVFRDSAGGGTCGAALNMSSAASVTFQ